MRLIAKKSAEIKNCFETNKLRPTEETVVPVLSEIHVDFDWPEHLGEDSAELQIIKEKR